MLRTKKDVDQHVEGLLAKLSSKEFISRGYSIGRLYYEVGDNSSCRRYVEQYLNQNNNNAAAHALLGQALQKLGQKEKALEEFETSFTICPSQNSLVLNICEILADGEVDIDPGRAKYWCDKAETMFPKHPVTYQLREKLLSIANPDPEALVNLLNEELVVRPKDVLLHIRLLQFYLKNNKIQEAFTHSCNVEFGENNFTNNFDWYKTIEQILKSNPCNPNDWLFQLLFLTVTERMCFLNLTVNHSDSYSKIYETTHLLHVYDQAIDRVAKAGIDTSHLEFHKCLLHHHRSQFAFLAATFLLKSGKDRNWSDATMDAESLMLITWHSSVFDPTLKWVITAPEIQQNAARRWYRESSYRCSQAGHFLLANINDKSQAFLDRISQNISGMQWKTKLYGKIFSSKYHLDKIETSHMISSLFSAPTLRLPKRNEVERYDEEAQRAYGGSLHHFVWLLLNYHDYSQFKCTTFEMLPIQIRNDSNCGPESLCQLDVYAFLFCATLASNQVRSNKEPHKLSHKPKTLPANITEWLCTSAQRKWWDCAYKFSRNELGTEMTDIRATLSRGIEIVRCIDNHGLDPELLCQLGRIFSNKAKHATDVDEKRSWEMRAVLYFSSAIPLFEKTRSTILKSDKCLFEYVNTCLLPKETRSLLEECKLYVALHQLNDGEHEKAIKLLSNAKSAKALYYLGLTYKKMALEEINYHEDNLNDDVNSKSMTLLSKAQNYGYEALSKLRDPENKSNHSLHMETEELLREIEIHLSKINYVSASNEKHDKNSSEEYISLHGNEDVLTKNQSLFLRNFSSTPKRSSNVSNYRTPVSSQIIENRTDQQSFDRLESQISILQKRDAKMNDYMEQTKNMCEENREIGNQIISMMNSNMKSTTDQFAQLKISIDKVKDEIDECRNECKDVGELKKQIAQMKKDINNLKKSSSEQVEHELFNLDEEYRANDNPSTFAAQLPFSSQQVLPSFNQRIIPPFSVPPNPFQLYGQNLFNLYNHYSQFSQPQSVPGAPPIFDAARTQVNYPGVFPTTDQMYLDPTNLVQQTMPTAPSIPVIPTTVSVPASITSTLPVVTLPLATAATTTKTFTQNVDIKDMSRSLPANVVITSSDPLPTCTTTPTPILSVTIPAKHIKNIPHKYQIQMPATEPVPAFGFPTIGSKMNTAPASSNWNKTTVFKDVFPSVNASSTATDTISFSPNVSNTNVIDEDANISNDSHNKSRTLSERSNTYVDNYDPCPDFKPIIPLPAEVKVTTGEEDETVIFNARAKLYRFVDNQWKERGLGEMKLLKHNITGKVRVLMRREQIHKICANHLITSEMEIKPMKNETKAYFWVANDFAEETLILEKFSIRFKTAEIAHQFYEAFEKARLETTNTDKQSKVSEMSSAKDAPKTTSANYSSPAKTVVGGFTFTSTPAFKPVDDSKPLGKQQEITASPKVNIFSGLNLKTEPSSTSFSNWFSPSTNQKWNDPEKDETVNKANVSDSVEAYEPTGDFEPVVPLPALVDTKTGEEDEIILFEHRAKLLRFVASSKEWKERGLGNIKLLVNKDNVQKLRLLMRREQVMKVCCNHAVTKAMSFQKMPKRDQAVTWYAQDYSEGELTPELFCLRFKSIDECDRFIDAVKTAQSKLKDDSKAAKEEQNAAKQNSQVGDNIVNQVSSKWGDKFKPKEGSWECKECFIRNEQSAENCTACKNSRFSDAAVKESKSHVKNETKFIIGEPSQIPNNNKAPGSSITGFGDKFKPKQGSWECQSCLLRNEPNIEICTACKNSKQPGIAKSESKGVPNSEINFKFGIPNQSTAEPVSLSTAPVKSTWGDKFKPSAGTWECKICYVRNNSNVETCCSCNNSKEPSAVSKPAANIWPSSKFNFGIPPNSGADGQKNATTSIFDGTGFHKFNFGIPSDAQGQSNNLFSKEDKTPNISLTPKLGNQESVNNSTQFTETKPALLPTPQNPTESVTFDFVFKPKTQTKAKSPMKSSGNERGEESDDNEYASEDEGHHIEITPIIPMPDKVKVVTGEEDEEELYGHRAKLLKFDSGEWKERGIGVVKVLKHKVTGKLRVVMRREQIFKICLNHALTSDINYNLKDEKNWIFAANDFSEGELSTQSFCLKFKTKEIALEFKNAIDKAREGMNTVVQNKQKVENKDTEDVQFITETQSNPEEKKKAADLMLPENFYLYKDKDPCPGCRGCKDDNDTKPNVPKDIAQSPISNSKNPLATENAPIDLTPELKVPAVESLQVSKKEVNSNTDVTKNEKSILQKPKLFSIDTKSSVFNSPVFSASPSTTTTNIDQKTDPKSIFAAANIGVSINKFSFFNPSDNTNSAVNSKPSTDPSSTVKSIFDGETTQNKFSFFGNQPNQSLSSQTSIFSSTNAPNLFSNGSIWSVNTKTDFKTPSDLTTKTPGLGSGETLGFDTFSKQPELKFQTNPDFKWAGAGQQIFATTTQKEKPEAAKGKDTRNKNDEDADNVEDEEYDPHYEPIVPLPDKITVTTGEEDEEKLYGARCKLYRYNNSSEWKERGVGELKILYHPEKKTYRLLFRREQVYKAVLNMLLHPDLELLPMKNSDRAWTWAGHNFAESTAGESETLAVRFKTKDLADEFFNKVKDCVRILQAAAAQAIREKQEKKKENVADDQPKSMAHLRLPKHLQDSARADNEMAMSPAQYSQATSKAPESAEVSSVKSDDAESELYNREEESTTQFSCDCEATVTAGEAETSCAQAQVQLLYDRDMYSPKILVSNTANGELLAEMLLLDETEFQLNKGQNLTGEPES
ncbi:hypothetical protein MSG28_000452 [Choristoneura fumiferana]|uniref:Uncharacterized protein n=1 Tax=Choristoneura fumiferana TaxID=7141 RepID=A0ACC0K0T9_CHOFU|nr:hypothetical protein MSG28_000452 [Choristoneura fumiferana]